MKVIRWLLSHIILILFIVVVIYGYMFWGNLVGDKTPAGKALAYLSEEFEVVAEFVDGVKQKQSKLNQSVVKQDTPRDTPPEQLSDASGSGDFVQAESKTERAKLAETDVSMNQKTDSAMAAEPPVTGDAMEHASMERATGENKRNEEKTVAAIDNSIKQKPVSISYNHDRKHVVQNSDGVIKTTPESVVIKQLEAKPHASIKSVETESVHATVAPMDAREAASTPVIENKDGVNEEVMNQPIADKIQIGEAAESFVSAEIEDQLNNVDDKGKVIDATKNETLRESWIIARKSFYQRDYQLSEQSYQKVIERTEDNFDAYGELGNVYFNQGKNQQAAAAYYEAAAILVRQGQMDRAKSLLGLLQHLDKSKAIELQKLLDSSVS